MVRSMLPLLVSGLVLVSPISLAEGSDANVGDKPSLTALSQEVAALQMIYSLRLTRPQLQVIRKIAAETAGRPTKEQRGKASSAYRQILVDLREALADAKDDERIDKVSDRLEKLRTKEEPEIFDGIDLTDEAALRAPQVLRLLSAGQVAGFLTGVASDIPDPFQRLREALVKVRGLSPDEWAKYREEISDEVGRLVAGLDDEKAGKIAGQVVQLLIVARSIKEVDLKARQPDLEKRARLILGDTGPMEVLRHVLEQALAEFLSNPQLPGALDARLK